MTKETHSGDVDVSHHERDEGAERADAPGRRSNSVAVNIIENPLKVRRQTLGNARTR